MANNYQIRVQINIEESEEEVSEEMKGEGWGEYKRVISQEEAQSIEKSEEYLLEMSYAAMRSAYGKHLSEMSEEYRREAGVEEERVIIKEYRVESELGRVKFAASYWQEGSGKEAKEQGLYEVLGGREWKKTRGFKEIAYEQGVVNESYRKAGRMLNRIRHQTEEEGTPIRTLCANAEAEGERVLTYLEQRSEEILKQAGFSREGSPLPESQYAVKAEAETACDWKLLEAESIQRAQRIEAPNEEWEIEMRANPVAYENPACSVQISLDDVGAKHQTEQRAHYKPPPVEELAYVHTTVAHIQYQESSYRLSGQSLSAVLRFLLAFLLHNQLFSSNLIFFVDGQRSLYSALHFAFAWFPTYQIILDWFHLEKRCRENLSMALKGKEIRNDFLQQLLPSLWHGCTDIAITLLQELDPQLVKNPDYLLKLIEYLERNRPYIPCYSVRKRLSLRNGSTRGEKANDLLVSSRQKHNGMSWSLAGSSALAALTALVSNSEAALWFRSSALSFTLLTNP